MRRWGDFGGACLLSPCEPTPDLLLPDTTVLGLAKAGSHVMGTWRDGDGTIHRFLRSIYAYSAPLERRYHFTNEGGTQLRRGDDAAMYGGPIVTTLDGDHVRFSPPGEAEGFRYDWTPREMRWQEPGMLDVAGEVLGPANQWFNPWRGGGGALVVSARYRARGTLLGREVDGFCGHEVHWFPPGRSFLDSPYGWGGREVTWGHLVTELEDGTLVDASLAAGRDGWGFAMLHDGDRFVCTTEVALEATVRPSGYPERMRWTFAGESWEWTIDERGEREGTVGAGMVGAEGVLRRVGDDRRVVRAMGTVDWWTDGRGRSRQTQ